MSWLRGSSRIVREEARRGEARPKRKLGPSELAVFVDEAGGRRTRVGHCDDDVMRDGSEMGVMSLEWCLSGRLVDLQTRELVFESAEDAHVEIESNRWRRRCGRISRE